MNKVSAPWVNGCGTSTGFDPHSRSFSQGGAAKPLGFAVKPFGVKIYETIRFAGNFQLLKFVNSSLIGFPKTRAAETRL